MYLKILVDECVDFRIINALKEKGIDIVSVSEEYQSISDKQVMEVAKNLKAILLTEDSDFGECFFSHNEKEVGGIFLRYKPDDREKISNSLIHVLDKYQNNLANKFTVIKANKIRIRDL